MKSTQKKIAQSLIATSLLTFTTPYAFAELKGMTDREMMEMTAQSGIRTLEGNDSTEEQRREEENRNMGIQAFAAINNMVPSELIKEIRDMHHTAQQNTRIHRELHTVQQDILAVPTAVTTVITIPAGLGTGGFFF
ncbi:hypothetical protein [Desulfoluna spongiiphila]|uniref:Uncharacterized protein n=1 Tax=Desulfoluna spongiiphila TaxID=419481 RepID=A0A1G5DFR3_9BACT|nr:hypothetical protein [Desulfoluna spongiiphila]SCY13387.1 hypothetical protein SAMN05216233_104158 [Desulfoluna spongiiphila]VVS95166.1 consensus disorder prediction [Desulfoluna spongiiphila]